MNLRGSVETLVLRLLPGSDVRRQLEHVAKREKISAGAIISAVGSLSKVCLRFANNKTPTKLSGKHEILTLSGTLGEEGVHLHMTVANSQGECKGGHLVYGCQVYTTLELVIALIPSLKFKRVFDEETRCFELDIASH
ncbi:MAG: PPC domain-containing DNA-binding protein [Xenococcaceae cyanobacterium]